MNVSVSPETERELINGAAFYAEAADRELGLAFIAEFEHAKDRLSSNPEIGALARFNASPSIAPLSLQPRIPDKAEGCLGYRFSASTSAPRVLGRTALITPRTNGI